MRGPTRKPCVPAETRMAPTATNLATNQGPARLPNQSVPAGNRMEKLSTPVRIVAARTGQRTHPNARPRDEIRSPRRGLSEPPFRLTRLPSRRGGEASRHSDGGSSDVEPQDERLPRDHGRGSLAPNRGDSTARNRAERRRSSQLPWDAAPGVQNVHGLPDSNAEEASLFRTPDATDRRGGFRRHSPFSRGLDSAAEGPIDRSPRPR